MQELMSKERSRLLENRRYCPVELYVTGFSEIGDLCLRGQVKG